jgi:ADP-L-glycero-D-manno-heptose 6-epimerase
MPMIVVTGGAGFIGSNIVAALAARGEEVTVCDQLRRSDKWRDLAKDLIAEIAAPGDLMSFLAGAPKVHAMVHMGAISDTTETDAGLIADTNLTLSLRLWNWCAEQCVPFIYASSAATYGDGSVGFSDDYDPAALALLRPLNAYGWSKHTFDRRVVDLIARGKPRPPQWVGLKFFNVYGPNEYHKGEMRSVLVKNLAAAAAGDPVRLFKSHLADFEDGGQMRDFVYVRDCVAVVLWLLNRRDVSGIFNVGSGQARSFRDLISALFRAAGYSASPTPIEEGVAHSLREYLS